MKLRTITDRYVRIKEEHQKKKKEINEHIERLERKTQWHKRRLDRLGWGPSWIDELLQPIAEMMLKHLPGRHYDILGPFGIPANTSIHFYKDSVDNTTRFLDDNCLSVSFRPGDLSKGELLVVDYKVNTKRFAPGTIGEMNDLNYLSQGIPMNADIQWLVDWMMEQNTEKVTP